ncbi:MAG TPA: helix-turn-helix domain-containing protein [Acidimicrobiales bacterium]
MDTAALILQIRTDGDLTQHQLAKRAGTSQSAVARYETGVSSPSVNTLERLVRASGAELTISTRPAPASDLSGELPTLLRHHRFEILQLAHRAGVTNVRIFGSVARGENDANSDVDLLVDFDTSFGLLPIVTLSQQISYLVKTAVDVTPVQLLKREIARNALRDAVPL